MNIHISKTPGKKIFGYTLLVNFQIFKKIIIHKYGILYVLQGCEWQIIKKEENSRVAFRAERFALKIALYYDFGQNYIKKL